MVTGLWFIMFERVVLKGELLVGCLFANALAYNEKCVVVLVTLLPWLLLLFIASSFFFIEFTYKIVGFSLGV